MVKWKEEIVRENRDREERTLGKNRHSRVLIAGTSSGSGKTTITCGIIQALVNRGLNVMSFKCGPDYIDPMFHRSVMGVDSSNLDLFMLKEETVNYLLGSRSEEADISIMEGVMGYYDGVSMDSTQASTYDIACKTDSPVILVVNGSGMAVSIIAMIKGYVEYQKDSHIKGVILNNISAYTYEPIKKAIEAQFFGKIKVLGYMKKQKEFQLKSRHLGLVTAEEVEGLKDQLQALASELEETLELDEIIALANQAKEVEYELPCIPKLKKQVRIGVARDKAFCFYYRDNLKLLEEMGAELVYFSPMMDKELPQNIEGLYLGGGYPEVHAETLTNNVTMRASIIEALNHGMPCYAECGGYMYLTKSIGEYPMVGYINTTCYHTGKLVRFGYATLTAKVDTICCKKGDTIACHEFHVWDTKDHGDAFEARKLSGVSWSGTYYDNHVMAGYPHLHFYSNPSFAYEFLTSCAKSI